VAAAAQDEELAEDSVLKPTNADVFFRKSRRSIAIPFFSAGMAAEWKWRKYGRWQTFLSYRSFPPTRCRMRLARLSYYSDPAAAIAMAARQWVKKMRQSVG
jgi:hypothetical protein